MKKIFTMLILTVCFADFVSAQQKVPAGVQKIVDNHLKDPNGDFGFAELQSGFNVDRTIKFEDIRSGTPIEAYYIDRSKLEILPETSDVNLFVAPANRWDIPIYAKGKCIYVISVYKIGQSWKCGSAGGSISNLNNEGSLWPENKGIDPILIEFDQNRFIHFPQKGKYNLTSIDKFNEDTLLSVGNYWKIGDSRSVLLKLRGLHLKQKKWLSEHPDLIEGGK